MKIDRSDSKAVSAPHACDASGAGDTSYSIFYHICLDTSVNISNVATVDLAERQYRTSHPAYGSRSLTLLLIGRDIFTRAMKIESNPIHVALHT